MMIGRCDWLSLDFNEIKHYFATGEKLAPPSMKDRIETAKSLNLEY